MTATGRAPSFRHEALLYRGRADFIQQTLPFIHAAVVTEQPILVAVDRAKIEDLQRVLGADAAKVRFEDMAGIGRNPARIIPLWRAFMDEHAGSASSVRGIGEPIWAERSSDELAECEMHEALLNLAFASPPIALRVACPYDRASLPAVVIDEARRNHPIVTERGASRRSRTYTEFGALARRSDAALPEPSAILDEIRFDGTRLHEVRGFIEVQASRRGLKPERVADLVLAVNEAVTNSVRYAGGGGTLRIWSQEDKVICEVRDEGSIDRPLVGRVAPDASGSGGFGLWLANQLCDLVQIRTSARGSAVRLHIALT